MATDSFWGNIFREGSTDLSIDAFLGRLPIFSGLKPKELKAVERIVHLRTYQPDEFIFRKNDPGVGMYIIRKGRVRIFLPNEGEDHQDVLLAELMPGDFFGEASLPDGGPRSATAIALEETHMIGLFRPDLLDLCKRDPQTGLKVLWNVCEVLAIRLRHTNLDLHRLRESETASGEVTSLSSIKESRDLKGKD